MPSASSSPTKSMVVYPGTRNLLEMSATHFGSVAEKSTVWRLALSLAWFRMVSISSTNPMLSISSASSSTLNLSFSKESVLRSRWSLTRPGVPMTMSQPCLSALLLAVGGTAIDADGGEAERLTDVLEVGVHLLASSRVGARSATTGRRPCTLRPDAGKDSLR